MKKYFLTKKQIAVIVKHYGGYKKYKLNEKIKKEYSTIHLCEKQNNSLWMTIDSKNENTIEVRFTDNTGKIIKRDNWELVDGVSQIIGDKQEEIIADFEEKNQKSANAETENQTFIKMALEAEKELSKGKKTINQVREEFGLEPLPDRLGNEFLTTNQCNNKME